MAREFKVLEPKNTAKTVAKNAAVKTGRLSVDPKTDEGTEEVATEIAKEIGGRGGLDPVRYGDWEIKGRCVDF